MTTKAVRNYSYAHTGAPSLTGAAGSLIGVLDAILLNGYNSKLLTSITRDGNIATAVSASHGLPRGDQGAVFNLTGADQAEYNGDHAVFNVTADTFQFIVSGAPVTPATGSMTAKVAGAGWSKAFSGTNLAAYRSNNVSAGQRAFYRVADTTTTYAAVTGYEAMSDVNTGASPFSPRFFLKSSTADATARPWTAYADDRVVFILVAYHATYQSNYTLYGFGDIVPVLESDAYCGMVLGALASTNGAPSTVESNMISTLQKLLTLSPGMKNSLNMSRLADGSASDVKATVVEPIDVSYDLASAAAVGAIPSETYLMSSENIGDLALILSDLAVFEYTNAVAPAVCGLRGFMPGIKVCPQVNVGSNTWHVFNGKRYISRAIGDTSSAIYNGTILIDVTGPWR